MLEPPPVEAAAPDAGTIVVARSVTLRSIASAGVAEALPFAPRRFDAAVSQFGLMFSFDRDGGHFPVTNARGS